MWQAFKVELPVFLRVLFPFLKEIVVMMLSLVINCIKALSYTSYLYLYMVTQMVNNLPAMRETWVQSLDQEDPLQKGMATHSSILTWRIPWIEEPDGLQSMGLQRIGPN